MRTDAPPAGKPGMPATATRGCLIGCLLAAAVSLGGCREPRAAVEGTVTFNGQPLHNGAIQFLPADGNYRKAASAAVVDGRYRIPVVTVGKKVVSVVGVKNGSKGPEPQPLPEDLEGNNVTVDLGPGYRTIDISLTTR